MFPDGGDGLPRKAHDHQRGVLQVFGIVVQIREDRSHIGKQYDARLLQAGSYGLVHPVSGLVIDRKVILRRRKEALVEYRLVFRGGRIKKVVVAEGRILIQIDVLVHVYYAVLYAPLVSAAASERAGYYLPVGKPHVVKIGRASAVRA